MKIAAKIDANMAIALKIAEKIAAKIYIENCADDCCKDCCENSSQNYGKIVVEISEQNCAIPFQSGFLKILFVLVIALSNLVWVGHVSIQI